MLEVTNSVTKSGIGIQKGQKYVYRRGFPCFLLSFLCSYQSLFVSRQAKVAVAVLKNVTNKMRVMFVKNKYNSFKFQEIIYVVRILADSGFFLDF